MSKTKPKLITLRNDQMEWLENHPEINVSGVTQTAIDAVIELHSSNFNLIKEALKKK